MSHKKQSAVRKSEKNAPHHTKRWDGGVEINTGLAPIQDVRFLCAAITYPYMFENALQDLVFAYATPNRYAKGGRFLTLNVTTPFTVSGQFRISQITITARGALGGAFTDFTQQITCSQFPKKLATILAGVV